MFEKRDHHRINCAEKCLLYHNESKYCGAIINISISGALIQLPGVKPDVIMPGETCSFILSNEPATCFCRYKGMITRVTTKGVGLEILEHDF